MVDVKRKSSLFYHDILNQVHGLNLFLEQKMSQRRVVSLEEIKILQREITVLESVIEKQFHDDLIQEGEVDECESLDHCESLVRHLCSTYFDEKVVIELEGIEYFNQDTYIDFPVFHRIFTNIVKNIAESGPTHTLFKFTLTDGQLHLVCENDFRSGKKIEKSWKKGFGLNSMRSLTQESGGEFLCFVEGSTWTTKVSLPIFSQEVFEKSA